MCPDIEMNTGSLTQTEEKRTKKDERKWSHLSCVLICQFLFSKYKLTLLRIQPFRLYLYNDDNNGNDVYHTHNKYHIKSLANNNNRKQKQRKKSAWE